MKSNEEITGEGLNQTVTIVKTKKATKYVKQGGQNNYYGQTQQKAKKAATRSAIRKEWSDDCRAMDTIGTKSNP